MGFIGTFFQWLYDILKKTLLLVVSLPGMIVSALASVVAAVGTMFGHFTWLSTATTYVNQATAALQSLTSQDMGPLGDVMLGWFNLGRLVQCVLFVIGATFGVTVVVFVTLFVSVFALVPLVLGVRAILKAIHIGSMGVAKP